MPEVKRPVRLHVSIASEGPIERARVDCPHRQTMVDTADCLSCARLRAVSGPFARGRVGTSDESTEVRCDVAAEQAIDPRADLTEIGSRTTVRAIMAPVTLSVSPEMPLAILRRILVQRGLRAAVVVDAEGKLQGLVSRADLTGTRKGCVGDRMARRVHALPEDAPITYAVGLMATANISEVPIVREDGTVIGLCHALDLLAWLAQHMGYVLPRK
jgi:CBS domain-containing protein